MSFVGGNSRVIIYIPTHKVMYDKVIIDLLNAKYEIQAML